MNTLHNPGSPLESDIIPFGEELLRPIDDTVDLGALACIYNLSSENDDSVLISGKNDDQLFTDSLTSESPDVIVNLN